ncbi:hypothetical protein GC101_15840 [Paenibacillus sp. LMG 31459]|uniref:Uncharacterized protein n=1 Tax=Paenibacillus phytohabitans TaxID=2654978 RepID=A0ABX1YH50_9BACL|nr:hypothetical protein [Paenibacillus phytohabitans]
MTHKELYDLHMQLLFDYEKYNNCLSSNQRDINYYKQQFFIAQDIVQRIFVLNQLLNLHEKSRAQHIKWCSGGYFGKNITEGEKT